LTGLAIMAMFIVVVIPTLPGGDTNKTILSILEPLLCQSNETLSIHTVTYRDSQGTTRSPHYYCKNEPAAPGREVTDTAVVYAIIGFAVPLVAGILLIIVGAMSVTRRAARSVGALAQASLAGLDSAASPAEKLQQLAELLAKNLITQDEYQRLRQEVLDESF
jgi:hypothetical protein